VTALALAAAASLAACTGGGAASTPAAPAPALPMTPALVPAAIGRLILARSRRYAE
jgi:hypothetical protein